MFTLEIVILKYVFKNLNIKILTSFDELWYQAEEIFFFRFGKPILNLQSSKVLHQIENKLNTLGRINTNVIITTYNKMAIPIKSDTEKGLCQSQ
jgi:hypothetical protein